MSDNHGKMIICFSRSSGLSVDVAIPACSGAAEDAQAQNRFIGNVHPDIPREMGGGLWMWEGEVTVSFAGLSWEGEWRRLTPAEAVVLAQGEDPFLVTMGDIFDDHLLGTRRLTG